VGTSLVDQEASSLEVLVEETSFQARLEDLVEVEDQNREVLAEEVSPFLVGEVSPFLEVQEVVEEAPFLVEEVNPSQVALVEAVDPYLVDLVEEEVILNLEDLAVVEVIPFLEGLEEEEAQYLQEDLVEAAIPCLVVQEEVEEAILNLAVLVAVEVIRFLEGQVVVVSLILRLEDLEVVEVD
jgi:hypothetical protein